MVMTDPIADMLTRIRNANMVLHRSVDVPASEMKLAVAGILKNEGYVDDVQLIEGQPVGTIRIQLKYGPAGERVISGLKRVSKPGRRVYVGRKDIPRVMGGLGVAILTTSNGILSDKTCRREGIGGEVICYVW